MHLLFQNHSLRLFSRKCIKSFHFLFVLFILFSVSLSFAGWVSFEDGRTRSSFSQQDMTTCTDISVVQNTCNLTISIPGVFEDKPHDFGLLAGNYSVFSLYGSALKIVNDNISGTFTPTKLGQPNLPRARFHVLVPSSVTIDDISIEVINTQFIPVNGTYFIAPIQEQVFDSYIPGVHRDNRVFQMNKSIYENDAFFTHDLEYELFSINKYKVLEIRYCPMQYNAMRKILLATKTAQFVITYKGGAIHTSTKPNNFTNTINKTTFDGITGVRNRGYVHVPRGGKFVIVSASPLINCPTMDELIAYHEGQGYEHVKTIDAGSTGSSEITSELKSLYSSEDIEFVQVIGDEEVVDIPTGGTDYHYKNWGWLDGTDTYEDIYLGVYLCNTEQGFKQIFDRQKLQEAGGEWTKTVVSTLGQQDSENPLKRFSSGHYGTRNWDNPEMGLGYTVHRVYKINAQPTQGYGGGYNIPGPQPWEEWALDPDPFYTSGTSASEKIYEYWNEGTCLIFHRDHGSNSGPSSPSIRMSSTVTTDCSPLFLSMNCLTGNFKGRHTSNFAYLTQSKVIGTCATLGATVVTYSGDNDLYAMAIFKGMVPEDGSPPERLVGNVHIMGSTKGQKHSRTFFHTYGDVMTMFSIGDLKPFLMVTSPGSGAEVEQHSTCKIGWGDNIDGNVKIELLKGGTLKETFASSTESDGSFEWVVPDDFELGDDYQVKITSIDSSGLTHTGETFSVVPEFIIAEFPYVQDYDKWDVGRRGFDDKWEQLTDDDIDWIVHTGPTPSKTGSDPDKTGPDEDNTTGNGNYIYIEASNPNNPDKKAHLITPKFNLNVCNNPVLSFFTHMFSAENEMGDLYLDINVDGTLHSDVLHFTDDQGDKWVEVKQDLNTYKGDRVRFIFRGITGASWCSDICIDDFEIKADPTQIINPISTLPSSFDIRYYGSLIQFQIPDNKLKSFPVSIRLYNLQGKMVKTLLDGTVKPGYYSIQIGNRQRLATGMYHCRMESKGFAKTINMLLLR